MALTTLRRPLHITTAPTAPLIDRYGVESGLFSTSRRTLLTQGRRTLITGRLATLPHQVATTLPHHEAAPAIAVGAITFNGEAHLIVPDTAEWAGPLTAPAIQRPHPAWQVRPVPDESTYLAAVRAALHRIGDGTLTKAVLARSLELTADARTDPRALLTALVGRGAYLFGVPLPGERT